MDKKRKTSGELHESVVYHSPENCCQLKGLEVPSWLFVSGGINTLSDIKFYPFQGTTLVLSLRCRR